MTYLLTVKIPFEAMDVDIGNDQLLAGTLGEILHRKAKYYRRREERKKKNVQIVGNVY